MGMVRNLSGDMELPDRIGKKVRKYAHVWTNGALAGIQRN